MTRPADAATLCVLLALALMSVQLNAKSLESRKPLNKRALQQQQQQQPQGAAGEQQEPKPEPYSFSYSADSLGGSATRQETGDSSGRVSGFYTIMGDDGRERRVDYVADENGYRASVSSNEVGMRAGEPSADVQLDVQLPSAKQLEAANSTQEEYKYLEQVHATERELQLTRLGEAQQQESTRTAAGQRQRFRESSSSVSSSSSSSSSSSASSASFGTPGANKNRQQQGLQRGANSLASNPKANQSSGVTAGGLPAAEDSSLSAGSANQDNFGVAASANQFSSAARAQSPPPPSPPQSSQSAGPNADAAADDSSPSASTAQFRQQQPQQQQLMQTSWQQKTSAASGNTSWQTAGRQVGVAGGNRAQQQQLQANSELQRQLEQQFLQEAVQLTDQDYPRQRTSSAPAGSMAQSSAESGQLQPQAMTTFGQQVAAGQVLEQVQPQIERAQQNTFATVGQQEDGDQLGGQQQVGANNEQQTSLVTSSGQSASLGDYAQYNQQQNNIINDVGGEQIDYAIQEDTQPASPQPAGQPQLSEQPELPVTTTEQGDSRQKSSDAMTTTAIMTASEATKATGQVPSGLVAINLSESSEQGDDQQQEISRTTEAPLATSHPAEQSQSALAGLSEVSSTSSGDLQQQQQVELQREEPQKRPNSVNQIIENFTRRPAIVEEQQQQRRRQQVADIARTATKTKQPQQLLPQSQFGLMMRQTISSVRPTTTTATKVAAVEQQRAVEQKGKRVQEVTTTTGQQLASYRPTVAPFVTTTTTIATTSVAKAEEAVTIEAAPIRTPQPQAPAINAAGVKGARVGSAAAMTFGGRNRYNNTMQEQQVTLRQPITTRAPAQRLPEQRFAANQETQSMMPTASTSAGQKQEEEEKAHVEYSNRTGARVTGSTATSGQQQWKAGTKGGSKAGSGSRKQFWRQQTSESSGDQLKQQQQARGGNVQQNSAAGANDYAGSLGYGSRVQSSRSSQTVSSSSNSRLVSQNGGERSAAN